MTRDPKKKDCRRSLIALILHPDERRAGATRGVYACCSSCCCCCCLHTIGGIVGAAVGSRSYLPKTREQIASAAPIYWPVLLGVTAVTALCFAFVLNQEADGRTHWSMSWFGGCFAVAMILPVVQLAASAVSALAIALLVHSAPPWDSLRRITWTSFWYAIAGFGIMIGLLLLVLLGTQL